MTGFIFGLAYRKAGLLGSVTAHLGVGVLIAVSRGLAFSDVSTLFFVGILDVAWLLYQRYQKPDRGDSSNGGTGAISNLKALTPFTPPQAPSQSGTSAPPPNQKSV